MYWTTRKLSGRLLDVEVEDWRALVLIPRRIAAEVPPEGRHAKNPSYTTYLTPRCRLDLWREHNNRWHSRLMVDGYGVGSATDEDVRVAFVRVFRQVVEHLTHWANGGWRARVQWHTPTRHRLREGLTLAESRLSREEL